MAQAVRTAWNASRHWLATGFLASTILFLLLMFINWRNEHRGIASQKAAGLTSVSVDVASAWHQKSILPWSSRERHVQSGLDSISGSADGMIGGVLGDRKSTRLNSSHRCISYAVFCLKKKN